MRASLDCPTCDTQSLLLFCACSHALGITVFRTVVMSLSCNMPNFQLFADPPLQLQEGGQGAHLHSVTEEFARDGLRHAGVAIVAPAQHHRAALKVLHHQEHLVAARIICHTPHKCRSQLQLGHIVAPLLDLMAPKSEIQSKAQIALARRSNSANFEKLGWRRCGGYIFGSCAP